MKQTWLSFGDWRWIQGVLPIVCVDVLPIRRSSQGVEAVGLILRETPHQVRRWCTIGGRLLYGESLPEAVKRQVRETLGPRACTAPAPAVRPTYVAQYSPRRTEVFCLGPRQHAAGLTYCLELDGYIEPQGEALSFQWFAIKAIPWKEIGFDQDWVIRACLAELGHSTTACP